jgi:hypothetical protein
MGLLPPDDDGPLQRVLSALSIACGAIAGVVMGSLAFLLATTFPAMLHMALPNMSEPVFLALWCGTIAIPAVAFVRAIPRGLPSGRAYAVLGAASLMLLFAGEITGTYRVYPWNTAFFITPGPYLPPTTPVPIRR